MPFLHQGQIAWPVSLSQGVPPSNPMTSHDSDLISKFGNEIRKGRGDGPKGRGGRDRKIETVRLLDSEA